ncbi:MAG: hypothetical protein ACOYXC_13060, partial [Candidatus Rifleibacteriota bacterium]
MKLFRQSLVLIGILVFMLSGVVSPASAKPYAINYRLTGELSVHKGIVYLNTADDRLFQLLMDENKAREFAGQIVSVDGKAAKADEIEQIKVKKIAVIPQSEQDMPVVEYEAYQKAPELISSYKGELKIKNVRWDISQDPQTKEKRAIHGWEVCTIRPEKVLNAYFILKPFAPKFLAAHSLFVFTFAPGGMVAADGKESTALALSIEAHKKIGQTYGLVKTM